MTDAAERAAEAAGAVAGAAVAEIAASAEAAVEHAEARVEAAEAARDAIAEAALRDELASRIDELETECEAWQSAADRRNSELTDRVTSLQAELAMVKEMAANPVVPTLVVPVAEPGADPSSISPASPQPEAALTPALIVEPGNASPAPIAVVPVVPARRKGRFL